MKVEKQIKITRDDGSELILSEEEIEKVKALLDLKPEVIRVRVPEPYPVYRWNRPWVPYDIYNSSDASGQIDCNVGDGVFVSSGKPLNVALMLQSPTPRGSARPTRGSTITSTERRNVSFRRESGRGPSPGLRSHRATGRLPGPGGWNPSRRYPRANAPGFFGTSGSSS